MIALDEALPPGALLDGAESDLATAISRAGALWLHGTPEAFSHDGTVVSQWRSHDGRYTAVPTQPNDGNGRTVDWVAGRRCALECRPGLHCGLVVPTLPAAADGRHAVISAAVVVRFTPPEPARTLLSINSDGAARSGTYLFLSDDGDSFTLKDTGGAVALSVPAAPRPDGPQLLTLTLDGDTVLFRQGDGPVTSATGTPPDLGHSPALFIGARSQRGGLTKTLGQSAIGDVFLWPGLRLLRPMQPADTAMDLALRRYMLWDC